MDREAADLRAEIGWARVELDRKLALLDRRARELSPRRLMGQYIHTGSIERVVGGLLAIAGLWMAIRQYRAEARRARRSRLAA